MAVINTEMGCTIIRRQLKPDSFCQLRTDISTNKYPILKISSPNYIAFILKEKKNFILYLKSNPTLKYQQTTKITFNFKIHK